MFEFADRVLRGYTRALDMLGGLFLAVMVVLVFGNVVLRYAFNSGLTMSEEVSRWLFVWLTFMGAVVALREHSHLGVDALVLRLPQRRHDDGRQRAGRGQQKEGPGQLPEQRVPLTARSQAPSHHR